MGMKRSITSLLRALGLCLTLAFAALVPAAESSVECQILYEITDGFYVSVGTGSQLEKGSTGWIVRDGQNLVRVEIVSVSQESSFVRIAGARPQNFPKAGEQITLNVTTSEPTPGETPRQPSPTLKNRRAADAPAAQLETGKVNAPAIPEGSRPGERPLVAPDDDKPFVPLLAPNGSKIGAFTDAYNIHHGQVGLRQTLQFTPNGDFDYFVTRFRTSGSLERIDATPWAMEWSGDLAYRDGRALEDVQNYQDIQLELYRLAVYRRFDDQSSVRIGRFLPRELPAVGYLDGAQGEWVLGESFRIGGMFGFKPDRVDLDFSLDEPTSVTYLTVNSDRKAETSYMGTFGLYASMYEGSMDRLAILADQTLSWKQLSIYSSSEIDFDVGNAVTHDGPRLTRLDLIASYPVWKHTTLRAGFDRFERPDTEAERDTVPALTLEEFEFFERAWSRVFIGASHQLPASFRLSEEISVTDSAIDEFSLRWNISLSKVGLPLLPASSSATLTVYNLQNEDLKGYGARLSSHIPFPGNKFSLQPEVGFRYLESDIIDNNEFTVSDLSLRAHWFLDKAWTLSAAGSYLYTEDTQRVLLDFNVSYKW